MPFDALEQKEASKLCSALSQAWNTIYNVLHLNKLAYDPEDATKCIRHPLIAILDSVLTDPSTTMDYLERNEVLLFLAQKAVQEPSNGPVIGMFFAHFIDRSPNRLLVGAGCVDAITLLLHGSHVDSLVVLHPLLQKMLQDGAMSEAYCCESVVRGSLEPIMRGGAKAVDLSCLICQCVTDFDLGDVGVYCKALVVRIIDMMMTGRTSAGEMVTNGDNPILQIDELVEKCRWEQFRVAFVETFREHCVRVLAETDSKYLTELLNIVHQPELTIPVGSALINLYNGENVDFRVINAVAEKVPCLVFSQPLAPAAFQKDFSIDKNELISVIDRDTKSESYREYTKRLVGRDTVASIPALKPDIRRLASQHRVIEGSPLEHLLLISQPIPVCMPATSRLCSYYLAYLQNYRQ